ncbi:MAG: hypothetical protein ACXVB0_01510 [Mucilaginibacter sp.]
MEPGNRIIRLIVMILILTGSLFYGASFFYFAHKARVKNLENNFKDTVAAVRYDLKGLPEVIIKGKRYYLTAGYSFEHKIETGDSLIKLKGQLTYKLVKKKSGVVFLFNNR